MTSLQMLDEFTSTGHKYKYHQEAMHGLRNGKPKVITCHLMITNTCNHSCEFCSTENRNTDQLEFDAITGFVDILLRHGLQGSIISGGGNPILYKCSKTGKNINDVVDFLHDRGLKIGLITNGMTMVDYGKRRSWKTVHPETLDKLTWIRISMAGLDHVEKEVFIPDIDQSKTTLGLSYINYDEGREEWLTERIGYYTERYQPRYVRLVADCLAPSCRPGRLKKLQEMADKINPEVVFVQDKPTAAPHSCYMTYVHPVLDASGFVHPCDSCTLQPLADRQFAHPWRVCHWSEVETLYTEPVRSLIDPQKLCPSCVFTRQCDLLESVVDGTEDLTPPSVKPEHAEFI